MSSPYSIFKYFIFILLTLLSFSCKREIDKKVITSADKQNAISILKASDGYYLVDGVYQSDSIPEDNYILNKGGLEYYVGLVNWTKNQTLIYSTYGTYDTTKTGSRLKQIIVSTKEFEQLKGDSLNFNYFYY